MSLVVVIKTPLSHFQTQNNNTSMQTINNIPFEIDRFPDLSIVLTEEFRPNIDICATYLLSHPQAMR